MSDVLCKVGPVIFVHCSSIHSVLLSVILFEPQVITEEEVSSHFGNEIIVA